MTKNPIEDLIVGFGICEQMENTSYTHLRRLFILGKLVPYVKEAHNKGDDYWNRALKKNKQYNKRREFLMEHYFGH